MKQTIVALLLSAIPAVAVAGLVREQTAPDKGGKAPAPGHAVAAVVAPMVVVEKNRVVPVTTANVGAEVLRSDRPVILAYCSFKNDNCQPGAGSDDFPNDVYEPPVLYGAEKAPRPSIPEAMEYAAKAHPGYKFGLVDLSRDPALRRVGEDGAALLPSYFFLYDPKVPGFRRLRVTYTWDHLGNVTGVDVAPAPNRGSGLIAPKGEK